MVGTWAGGVGGYLSGCVFVGESLNRQMTIYMEVCVGIHAGRQEKTGKVYRR